MSSSRREPATAPSDAVWTDGLRIGAVWVTVAGLAALLAWLTNPAFPHLRAVIPFLTWPLMTPWVAHWARRFPLGRRRAWLAHVAAFLAAAAIHGVLFRLVMMALGRGFPPLPASVPALTATLGIELLLYLSTALPIIALLAMRRAQEVELARARAEADVADAELDATLQQLGPQQLDAMLGKLRLAVEDPERDADTAITALASYLRSGLAAVEDEAWTRGREIAAVEAYLAFEQSCGGRRLELVRSVDEVAESSAVRRYGLVSAVAAVIAATAGPLRLQAVGAAGGQVVEGRDPATGAVVACAEVA